MNKINAKNRLIYNWNPHRFVRAIAKHPGQRAFTEAYNLYYKGRKAVSIDKDTWNKYYSMYLARELTKVQLANELGVSRPTLDKLIKEHKEAN